MQLIWMFSSDLLYFCGFSGAAFTRFQTLRLQKVFPNVLADQLISYGSCQFPTLGFVVERYKQVQQFVAEPFWKIHGKFWFLISEIKKKILAGFCQMFCVMLSAWIQNHRKPVTYVMEKCVQFWVVTIVPDDGFDAGISGGTTKTKGPVLYMGQVTKLRLSCYLVLLSVDSKTR